MQCPNGTHYDTIQKLCLKCQDGYLYNSTLNTCVSKCTGDTQYNPSTGNCQCPQDKPIAGMNNLCYSCELPKYWDINANLCRECAAGLHYNKTLGQCYICPSGFTFNLASYSCVLIPNPTCVGNQVYNTVSKICECPTNLSYFTGTNCV